MENPAFCDGEKHKQQDDYHSTSAKQREIELPTTELENHVVKQKSLALNDLQYGVEDCPPWHMCILLGFQHYLTMFGALLSVPLLLAPPMCVGEDNIGKSELISTIFFVSGVVTLIQTTFGCRLPIVQGGSFSFVAPAFAILSTMEPGCPKLLSPRCGINKSFGFIGNVSSLCDGLELTANGTVLVTGSDEHKAVWQSRLRELQGAIMLSSLFEVVIGFSGVIGFLLRYIGPLTITPTITLIGLALFVPAANFCSGHWWIALTTMVVITLFSQYLKNIGVPCGKNVRLPIFKLFPVILAVAVMWPICAILTAAGVLPEDKAEWGYKARTDTRLSVLTDAAWIRFPYPGQWGTPTVTVAGVFGMLAGVLASMIESVGDYFACARLSGAPPPPVHAVNRGIGTEGLGCFLAGAWGTGNGTTSYSQNIGMIGITKVGSRRVVQVGAFIAILLALVGKFGALFVTIPDPVIGGVFVVTFGMVASVGLSNLQFVDLNSSRNLFIVGFSIFIGLTLPLWISNPVNSGAIDTGNAVLDQIFKVLLSTSMFVGGFTGFLLDNTMPGTDEERGIAQWRAVLNATTDEERQEQKKSLKVYDMPFGMKTLKQIKILRFIPFCPTFDGFCVNDQTESDESRTSEDIKAEKLENVLVDSLDTMDTKL